MKLWQTKEKTEKIIERFTIGDDPIFDMQLAPYDLQGSLAHAAMLHHIGYITDEEWNLIHSGLQKILQNIKDGQFEIDEGVEDIHSQVEFTLIEMIGEAGKKLHLGRSRNDQIAVDLKLYYRDFTTQCLSKIKELGLLFCEKAESTKDILMPGYTHSQVGMVSSFGLWYSSFAEALADDYILLKSTASLIDKNPLGSAAGYGSSLPNDRDYSTEKLNFSDVYINSIYAQVSRGKSELQLAQALVSLGLSLNRFASDTILFSNENYQFLQLPDALTTGSSIMPQKKNPDVLELVRAKTNQLSQLPNQILAIMTNMQTGYHRDYQLLKELVFPALEKVMDTLDILLYCIPRITESHNILSNQNYKYAYSVENINALVKAGTPFRDAYHRVKQDIAEDRFFPTTQLNHTHLGSIGNLGIDRIKLRFERS